MTEMWEIRREMEVADIVHRLDKVPSLEDLEAALQELKLQGLLYVEIAAALEPTAGRSIIDKIIVKDSQRDIANKTKGSQLAFLEWLRNDQNERAAARK